MASSCESDFVVLGLQPGEEIITPIRTAATVVIITVTSAWSSLGKIKRLRLFFAHWLSGMVMSLGYVIDDVVVDLCWISSNMEGFIKTIKFIEHTASNMLAITNLAICINLALIVLGRSDALNVLTFVVEFIVGVSMLCIVSWLLLFRMGDIKECWKLHRRIRYYFCLTIIGTAVNLGLGICGTINASKDERVAMASSCESDFLVLGLQPGEEFYVPIRTVATIVTITVASAWCSLEKIKRLRLFFAHWLSGLVMSLAVVIDDMMIDVCWTSKNMEGFIKTIKFIEFSGSNMLAITNLAICVNLALIVLSHRTMNRVKSLSSAGLTLTFLVISMSIAAASIPFCDVIIVAGTAFLVTSYDEVRFDVLVVLNLIVEFIAGVCMAIIVTWMLVFRMEGIKECWKLHRRIRYYFILTIIGIVVNLFHGISITIIVSTNKIE
eukprot:g5094.t1